MWVLQELAVRQFLLTNLVRAKDGSRMTWRVPINYLAAALDDMADFPFRNPDEVRYEKPTLFIRGTKSHYIPDETLPIIGRFFPRFQVVDVEAGHWVISENPEAFRKGKPAYAALLGTYVNAHPAVVEFLQDKE
jgi:pimeloyl-ACP methyl ester carboxylesterase